METNPSPERIAEIAATVGVTTEQVEGILEFERRKDAERPATCACSVSGLHFGPEDPRHADHLRLYHGADS